MWDDLFTVSGGDIWRVWRATPNAATRDMYWNITVEPDGNGDVTLALNATDDCAGAPGVCKKSDGAMLTGPLSLRVAGPASLSVADATVEEAYRRNWWRHVEPRQGMWRALDGANRCIATARVAKHRLFVWLNTRIVPDSKIIVIARDDDVTFGILHSRFHQAWSLRLCSWHGVGNDPVYNPSTVFQTFPFPDGLTPNVPTTDYIEDPRAVAIAEAARRLVDLRNRWLYPAEWVDWIDEPVPAYPKRPVARDGSAKELRSRTLTNLYNARPKWLADAHAVLDAAVAAAYGWSTDIGDEEALRQLLAMNLCGVSQQQTCQEKQT